MCVELGRWLRAAGYDTAIVETDQTDPVIFAQAVQEKRHLLTRDHYFKEIDPAEKTAVYLKGEFLDAWAEQLKSELGVDWLLRPFSRCLDCNSLLEKTLSPPHNPKVPQSIEECWCCPTCQHIFWLGSHTQHMESRLSKWQDVLIIGLGGDVMIGRFVNDFLENSSPSYVWGDLLPILHQTDWNLINLETTLTHSEEVRHKVFNFKATPEKVASLTAGFIQAVNVANNHILDYAEEGLLETLRTLDKAHILHVGTGKNLKEAKAPLIVKKKGIKIGLLGCTDNEPSWNATSSHPGTFFVEVGDLEALSEPILALRKQVDLLIVSIHWGPNMRTGPTHSFRSFAHALIDLGVDILHGHSAHIFQGVEAYKNKLILYDTGDLVDDYAVDPVLRNDRSFFFVVKADKNRVISVTMIPTLIAEFQVNVSHSKESLRKMKELCNKLHTFPMQEEDTLILRMEAPS